MDVLWWNHCLHRCSCLDIIQLSPIYYVSVLFFTGILFVFYQSMYIIGMLNVYYFAFVLFLLELVTLVSGFYFCWKLKILLI